MIRTKAPFLLLVLLLVGLLIEARAQAEYPFQHPALPLEQRVENILSLMTLEEKIACLSTNTAVPRLRIPNIGGARSFMASYNKWNGVPMLLHPSQKTVLVDEWGIDGIFSTDAGSVGNLVTQQKYLKTMEEALAATIKAGHGQLLWFAFADGDLKKTLTNAFNQKLLIEADLDAALKGKFRTAIRLGVLDPKTPYSGIGAAGEPEPWTTEKHKAIAREVARESVVLLKNAGSFLPLNQQSIKSIAVIGSRADKVETDCIVSIIRGRLAGVPGCAQA